MKKLEINKIYQTGFSNLQSFKITHIFDDIKNEKGDRLYIYENKAFLGSAWTTHCGFYEDNEYLIYEKRLIFEETWQEEYKEYIEDNFFLDWNLCFIEDVWLIDNIFYIVNKPINGVIKKMIYHITGKEFIETRNSFNKAFFDSTPLRSTAFNAIWKNKPNTGFNAIWKDKL